MTAFRTSADRRIGAALADADNALTDAQDHTPTDPANGEERALDRLGATCRSLLIALTEVVAELRAGAPGPEPDEVAAAEGAIVSAAYHLVLAQPEQYNELLARLRTRVRRHHAALGELTLKGGGE